jgi:hypothetical protein
MESGQRGQIEQLLYGLPFWEDPGQRKVLLGMLLRGHPIWLDIKYGGSQTEAADSLLGLCEQHASRLLGGKLPVCALLQWLSDLYGSDRDAGARIERLVTEFCARRADRLRPPWKGTPYRGLAYFDRRHWPIFFGREAELQGLIDALSTEQGQRFLIVVGDSGCGKSSLVRAGLWAGLEHGDVPEFPGSGGWLIAAMRPAEMGSPMEALRAATVAAIKERDGFEGLLDFDWDQALADIESGSGSLAALAERLLAGHPGCRWLLILDQMEELFTTVDEARREAFIEQLIDASKPGDEGKPRFQVLGTLRADFFHHCVGHPNLKLVAAGGGQFLLGPPDRLSLERMVSGPLTDVDLLDKDSSGNWQPVRWGLDPRLAPEIAAEAVGREGGLALMAFALRELYERCAPQRHLDFGSYKGDDFGGLGGAIARRADAAFAALGDGFGEALGRVFARLTRISGDEPPTRQRERLSAWDQDPEARRLIDRFVQARLLVARKGNPPTVEVAHEALLREWPRLVEWIKDSREAIRLKDKVRDETGAWLRAGRSDTRRWRHELLDPSRRLLAEADLLADLERDPNIADFLIPEADWLIAELLCSGTDHARREAIGMRLSEIGDPRRGVGLREDGVPDILWCEIPEGEVEIEGQRCRKVPPFRIAAYPVTYAQYKAFLEAEDGYRSERWWDDLLQYDPDPTLRPYASYPATNVSWYDATAFCRWLSSRVGFEARLPDEWEWQWAAQSARRDFVYPWGEDWQEGVANTGEAGIGRTTAVGMYPGGCSAQGVYDLAGNVREWCRNKYDEQGITQPSGHVSHAVRGGYWLRPRGAARADARDGLPRSDRYDGFDGFRVVCSSPIR